MATEFKIDLSKFKQKLLNSVVSAVEETIKDIYIDVRLYSPIDTGKYLSQHKYKGVRIEGNKVIGEVENIGEYSEKVETGWKKTRVNWNLKNLSQIYNSKGANVYAKAIAKNKDKFLNKLKGQ